MQTWVVEVEIDEKIKDGGEQHSRKLRGEIDQSADKVSHDSVTHATQDQMSDSDRRIHVTTRHICRYKDPKGDSESSCNGAMDRRTASYSDTVGTSYSSQCQYKRTCIKQQLFVYR